MKAVTAPRDLYGRLIICEHWAKALAFSLEAMARAHDDLGAPNEDVLDGLSDIAEELQGEILAIQHEYTAESNECSAVRAGK